MTRYCLDCGAPIDPNSLSFEQKLVGDTDFCRQCWDRIMAYPNEGMEHLDNPRYLALT